MKIALVDRVRSATGLAQDQNGPSVLMVASSMRMSHSWHCRANDVSRTRKQQCTAFELC